MGRSALYAAFLLAIVSPTASAIVFSFDTDPFAGSTALSTPGRQVVGGEPSISFNPATDVFAFDPAFFAINGILFVNDVIAGIPTSGVDVIVLRTLDDDANAGTPFAAGNAASLIASQITSPGAGLFIYFNSGLDLPRLVYSTDLNQNTSDLKILARMTNLTGQSGALPDFAAANFDVVPEPSTLSLVAIGMFAFGLSRRR